MGCMGVGDVVAVAKCEHFHRVLYNPLVVIKGIAVTIRKNAQCEWTLIPSFLLLRIKGVDTRYFDSRVNCSVFFTLLLKRLHLH